MASTKISALSAALTLDGTEQVPVVQAGTTVRTTVALLNAQSGTTGAWTAYTPTWTSTGTAPAVGNGTLSGAYIQIGRLVTFRLNLTYGSTTTSGTGTWRFGYPVTAATLAATHGLLLAGCAEDAGVTAYGTSGGRQFSTTEFEVLYHTASAAAVSLYGAGAPFGWGNGDWLRVMGSYEAASG